MIGKVKEIVRKYPKVSKTFGWVLLVAIIMVATSIFFISYSLARHKRMVAQLRAQVIAQNAKIKVMESEKRLIALSAQLKELKSEDAKHVAAREQIRTEIEKESVKVEAAKKTLDKDLKKMDKKGMSQLLKESRQLLKEVL